MDNQEDILHIAKYFIGRYGAAAAALMESRASACEHEGDVDAAGLWRCVASEIRKVAPDSAEAAKAEVEAVPAPAAKAVPDSHVRRAFEATPHPYLLLTPDLTIAGANESYLSATLTCRGEIVGRPVFEALPDNPAWPDADGVRNLGASLARVIDHRRPDRMALQRYDVRRPDGAFEERWWSTLNTPAFDADGRLVLIVHHTQELKTGRRGSA
jgi:hypothetical protein